MSAYKNWRAKIEEDFNIVNSRNKTENLKNLTSKLVSENASNEYTISCLTLEIQRLQDKIKQQEQQVNYVVVFMFLLFCLSLLVTWLLVKY